MGDVVAIILVEIFVQGWLAVFDALTRPRSLFGATLWLCILTLIFIFILASIRI